MFSLINLFNVLEDPLTQDQDQLRLPPGVPLGVPLPLGVPQQGAPQGVPPGVPLLELPPGLLLPLIMKMKTIANTIAPLVDLNFA